VAAYLVVETDWKDVDLETRTTFGKAARPVFENYGGKFLTTPGQGAESIEGDWHPPILTIVEFPNSDAVRQMMDSPDFKSAAAIRRATNAEFKLVLVEGA
jgi:uncharacterized protein (DUF1330 family)